MGRVAMHKSPSNPGWGLPRRQMVAALTMAPVAQALAAKPTPAGPAPAAPAAPSVAVATPAAQAAAAAADVTAQMWAQREAWNRGDIAGFCAPYADDCIFLSPSGVTRGRQVVQDNYTRKYGSAPQTMGRLDFEILDTRSTPDSVTLAMRWSLTWADRSAHPPRAGTTLIVWQRQGGRFRLVQDASM